MAMWQLFVKTILISLFSGLVVFALVAVLNLSRRHPVVKRVYEALLSRTRIILVLLVLLILLMPIAFSLVKGTALSEVLAVYVRNLLVSVVTIVSFSVTWKVLNNLTPILRPFKAIYETAKYAIISYSRDAQTTGVLSELQIEIPSLNDALLAWDCGEMSQGEVREIQMLESLEKWIRQEDETAWYELQEEIEPGNRLQHLGARFIVERELWRAQQERHRTWNSPSRNGEYEKQLRSLLSSLETPSLNDALLAWDRGEISRDKVREIQILETLGKCMWREDDTGWYDLREEIGPGNQPQHLGVCLIHVHGMEAMVSAAGGM